MQRIWLIQVLTSNFSSIKNLVTEKRRLLVTHTCYIYKKNDCIENFFTLRTVPVKVKYRIALDRSVFEKPFLTVVHCHVNLLMNRSHSLSQSITILHLLLNVFQSLNWAIKLQPVLLHPNNQLVQSSTSYEGFGLWLQRMNFYGLKYS
jgi:hypothetical protein